MPSRTKARKTIRKTGRKATAHPKRSAAPKARPRFTPVRREPQTLRLRAINPSLTVNDLDRSIRFYTDGLGFVVRERWGDGGQGMSRGAVLRAGTCDLMLGQDDFAKGRDRPKGIGHRLWLTTVQDVDALAARAKAGGITLEYEPRTLDWGTRAFAVVDPDGFRVTICRET